MKPVHFTLLCIVLLQLETFTYSFGTAIEKRIPYTPHLDTVFIPQSPVLVTKHLKQGTRQYLVYITQHGKPNRIKMRLWQRKVSVEKRNQKKVFVIDQHWLSYDSVGYTRFRSINNYSDFRPLYHYQKSRHGVAAYNWHTTKIQGADSVDGNLKKDFSLSFNQPNLNWNLDLETFEMLPMDKYKIFVLNFYDAGIDAPQKLVYKVIGEEAITLYGSTEKVDCWKLFMAATYKGMKFTETFWISKNTHELLMEKDDLGNGSFRYKIKLPVFATVMPDN